MNPKLSRFEHNEEFIAMLREEQRLWDVMSPLKRDDNENDKSLKTMSDDFRFFQTDIFEYSFVSNAKYFLPWRFLNFSYVFKLALKLH